MSLHRLKPPALNVHYTDERLPPGSYRANNAGLTLIELLFVLIIVSILAAIAYSSYVKLIHRARESATLVRLHHIIKAEESFRVSSTLDAYSGDFEELEAGPYVPRGEGSEARQYHDYRFVLRAGRDYWTGEPFWNVTAYPVDSSTAGARWFYVDETSIIRFEVGSAPSASSPPIK